MFCCENSGARSRESAYIIIPSLTSLYWMAIGFHYSTWPFFSFITHKRKHVKDIACTELVFFFNASPFFITKEWLNMGNTNRIESDCKLCFLFFHCFFFIFHAQVKKKNEVSTRESCLLSSTWTSNEKKKSTTYFIEEEWLSLKMRNSKKLRAKTIVLCVFFL